MIQRWLCTTAEGKEYVCYAVNEAHVRHLLKKAVDGQVQSIVQQDEPKSTRVIDNRKAPGA
jgi:hypothetical protein